MWLYAPSQVWVGVGGCDFYGVVVGLLELMSNIKVDLLWVTVIGVVFL